MTTAINIPHTLQVHSGHMTEDEGWTSDHDATYCAQYGTLGVFALCTTVCTTTVCTTVCVFNCVLYCVLYYVLQCVLHSVLLWVLQCVIRCVIQCVQDVEYFIVCSTVYTTLFLL